MKEEQLNVNNQPTTSTLYATQNEPYQYGNALSCRLFMYTNCTFCFRCYGQMLYLNVYTTMQKMYMKSTYKVIVMFFTSIRLVGLMLKIISRSRHIVFEIFTSAAILKFIMQFCPFPSSTEICRLSPLLTLFAKSCPNRSNRSAGVASWQWPQLRGKEPASHPEDSPNLELIAKNLFPFTFHIHIQTQKYKLSRYRPTSLRSLIL